MEYNLYTFSMWRGIADYLNNSGKFNYYFLTGKIKIWIVIFPLSHTNSQQIYVNNYEDLHIIQFYSNISFIFSLKCCFLHIIKSCFLIKLLQCFLRWLSPTGWLVSEPCLAILVNLISSPITHSTIHWNLYFKHLKIKFSQLITIPQLGNTFMYLSQKIILWFGSV